jgi:hypothetical protein
MGASASSHRPWLSQERTVLLVVALVVAFGLGWMGWQVNWISQRRAFLAEMTAKLPDSPRSYVCMRDDSFRAHRISAVAPWPLRWFGEERNEGVYVSFPRSSPEVARACRLFPEAKVFCFPGPLTTDAL